MPKHYSNRDRKNNSQVVKNFKQFQEEINVTFENEKLLFQAFTHSSYVNCLLYTSPSPRDA